jgi:hypothetical protein
MNNTVLGVLAFSLGAAVGSLVTYKVLETKFNKMLDDEIRSAKEYYSNKSSNASDNESEDEQADNKDSQKTAYIELARQYSENTGKDEYKPYVIPPEAFGEDEDYEVVSLTYFKDGVIAYDDLSTIDNVDEVIGEESLTHFGDYEDDSVFVRDDERKIDYEILRVSRTYAEQVDKTRLPGVK